MKIGTNVIATVAGNSYAGIVTNVHKDSSVNVHPFPDAGSALPSLGLFVNLKPEDVREVYPKPAKAKK
jgi:hypothetical protein